MPAAAQAARRARKRINKSATDEGYRSAHRVSNMSETPRAMSSTIRTDGFRHFPEKSISSSLIPISGYQVSLAHNQNEAIECAIAVDWTGSDLAIPAAPPHEFGTQLRRDPRPTQTGASRHLARVDHESL
jgi:hypothetical protein